MSRNIRTSKTIPTEQYNEGWDGRRDSKGEISETGIYIWKLIIADVFKERHEFTGHVTLIK